MIWPMHFFIEMSGFEWARAVGPEKWMGLSSIWVSAYGIC